MRRLRRTDRSTPPPKDRSACAAPRRSVRRHGTPPACGDNLCPRRQDAFAYVRADQGYDGGVEGGRPDGCGYEETRHPSRKRAERTDDGVNAWCERQHMGEPSITEGERDDVRFGFAAQRTQRCDEGWRVVRPGKSSYCPHDRAIRTPSPHAAACHRRLAHCASVAISGRRETGVAWRGQIGTGERNNEVGRQHRPEIIP